MADDAVLFDLTDNVATITLNRPDKLNALSEGIKDGLEAAMDRIEGNEEVRCVVLEGEGRAFSAGGDVSSQQDRLEGEQPPTPFERANQLERDCERIAVRLYNLHVPTVAKIDGYCVGAGMGLAFACDLHLASERSQFGLAFRNVGLALDFGVSFFIPRQIGLNKAKELAITGEMISADRAEELGLLNHVYPDDEFEDRVDDFVRQIADGPTVAVGYSARHMDRAVGMSLREAIEMEANAQTAVFQTEDHAEGVASFHEDREANFQGR